MNAQGAFAQRHGFEPDGPLPLKGSVSAPEPFPVIALGPLRPVVEAVQDLSQAPIEIAAQSALAVTSLVVQAHSDVDTLGGRKPTSIFALTIARSGERKSRCDELLMAGVHDYQRELAEEARRERPSYENSKAIWDAQRSEIVGRSKKEPDAARADLEALGPEPEPPLSPRLIVTEPTFPALVKKLADSRPALGIFSDEGGAFVGGHAMSAENRLNTVAGLSDMWGGKPINRTRAGDGEATFFGRRLACHLMIQPVVAAALLSDPIARGQGFLGRFLIADPKSTIGTRLFRESASGSQAVVDSFSQKLRDILDRNLPLREHTRNELEPAVLELSSDARALLIKFYDAIEVRQIEEGALEDVTPFASKAAEHACRIAGVLTLFANLDARSITGEMMAHGCALAEHYATEAARLAAEAEVSAELHSAGKLRQWLTKWPEPVISVAEIVKCGPARLRNTKLAKKLVKILVEHGHLMPVKGGGMVRGQHRREVFQIVEGEA
ncbi:MAG: YfjI family protein [Pseudomonadota bacterium]